MLHPEAANCHTESIEIDGHSLTFDLSRGGRLTSWRFREFELLGTLSDDPVENGCYPMVPWAGRLLGNTFTWQGNKHLLEANYYEFALHGFLLDRPVDSFDTKRSPESVEFNFSTRIDNWIAPIRIDIRWCLLETEVRSTITAMTDSSHPVPVVLGWHPWFRNAIGGDNQLTVDFSGLALAVKDGHVPSGEFVDARKVKGPFDDLFISPSKAVQIQWGSALELNIVNSHQWFVIYTGAENFTCVEPQTGPPNAFNNPLGCHTLTTQADAPLTMTTNWRLSTH